MGIVNGNERVRVRANDSLAELAKKHKVKAEDITHADGTPAADGIMPGETLVIHHKQEPNRTQALIKLMAEAMAAKQAAEEAKQAADEAKAHYEASEARESANRSAANDFNGTVKKVRILLSKGESNDCSLADREKTSKELTDLVKAAEEGASKMDESSQSPALEVVEGLKGRADKVAERATNERKKLTELDGMVDGDYKAMTAAVDGRKQNEDKTGKALQGLFAKYQDAAKHSEGLPPDARKAISDKIGALNHDLYRTIVRFSDESWMDRRDNAYLFGRPGPKMIKHTKEMEKWLATPPGPVSHDQRRDILEHLSEMDEAVRDFDDPTTNFAAKAVYDEIAAKAFARMSGK